MFTDDLYKQILVDEGGKLTNAHIAAIKNKMGDSGRIQWIDLTQIENSYQLFRKKYPEYPENSFRRLLWVRFHIGATEKMAHECEEMFKLCGWKPVTQSEIEVSK